MVQAPSLLDRFRCYRSEPMPQTVTALAADCGLTVDPKPGRVVLLGAVQATISGARIPPPLNADRSASLILEP